MFLTGRRVEEPDAKEPSKDEKKKEKEALDRQEREGPPAAAQLQRPGQAGRAGARRPATASSSRRAIVNRIWYRLFGQGLVMPLDQMHSANPPSHPELLAWLARDLADHGYDLRRLIRGPGPLRGLLPRQPVGRRRRSAPPVALCGGARAAPHAAATGDVAARWQPLTRRACRRTSNPTSSRSGSSAVEDSGRSLRRRRSRPPAATPRSASPRPFFSNGKRISQRSSGGRPRTRLVNRLEHTARPAEVVDLAVRTCSHALPMTKSSAF